MCRCKEARPRVFSIPPVMPPLAVGHFASGVTVSAIHQICALYGALEGLRGVGHSSATPSLNLNCCGIEARFDTRRRSIDFAQRSREDNLLLHLLVTSAFPVTGFGP